MKTKEAFHQLIDNIQDEDVLRSYFELIKKLNSNQSGTLWDSLTDDQKKDLMLSYDESFDKRNLVGHEEVKKNYDKWLKK